MGREVKNFTAYDVFRELGIPTRNLSRMPKDDIQTLESVAVLCACRVLAEGVAQVPWKVFRTTADGRQPATDHRLYDLLSWRPNEFQTSFAFRETLMFHLVLTGNAYVFLDRVGNRREINALLPIEPGRVRPKYVDGAVRYDVMDYQRQEIRQVPAELIWHIRGPAWSPWVGMSATKMVAKSLQLSESIEDTQYDHFENGAKVSGVYSVDGKLSPEQYEKLVKWLEDATKNAKPLVIDNGAKWLQQAMTAVDSQLIETRKYQLEEIGRAFRVLPIMLMHSDKTATYASAEQMFIAHVVHTLSPWYERLEQSADVNLLTRDERAAGHYTKFIPNGLMRGASKDRAEFYAKALGSGGSPAWMTQNEVREAEDMNRLPDADELFMGATQGNADAGGKATDGV